MAALAIPLTTPSGAPFPQRDLILFLTFCVILVTLVGQGAVMPAVMRSLGLADASRRERLADRIAEQEARREAAQTAVKLFDRIAKEKALPKKFVETFAPLISSNSCPTRFSAATRSLKANSPSFETRSTLS